MSEDLKTTITVEIDDSSLDEAIEFCNGFDFLEEVSNIFTEIKNGIKTGASDGVSELAEVNQSFQEMWISMNGSIVTGNLIGSIIINQESNLSYSILPEPDYAWYVEKGRGEVRPVTKKVLHFYIDGQEIFTRYSSPAKPRPFVEPAFNQTEDKAIEVIEEAIMNVID